MTSTHFSTRRRPARRARFRQAAGAVVLSTLIISCGSAPSDDDVDIDDTDTVVPPEIAGVDGGVPNDNLNPELDGPPDDVDGDGAPDG